MYLKIKPIHGLGGNMFSALENMERIWETLISPSKAITKDV